MSNARSSPKSLLRWLSWLLEHELTGIGTHIRKVKATPEPPNALHELSMPALVVIGENDLPYLRLAADYMTDETASQPPSFCIPDAGHLPNLEHPALVSNAGILAFPRRMLSS